MSQMRPRYHISCLTLIAHAIANTISGCRKQREGEMKRKKRWKKVYVFEMGCTLGVGDKGGGGGGGFQSRIRWFRTELSWHLLCKILLLVQNNEKLGLGYNNVWNVSKQGKWYNKLSTTCRKHHNGMISSCKAQKLKTDFLTICFTRSRQVRIKDTIYPTTPIIPSTATTAVTRAEPLLFVGFGIILFTGQHKYQAEMCIFIFDITIS